MQTLAACFKNNERSTGHLAQAPVSRCKRIISHLHPKYQESPGDETITFSHKKTKTSPQEVSLVGSKSAWK